LADVVVARYPGGLATPARLELSGPSPWVSEDGTSEGIRFNGFTIDWLGADGEIPFHFSAEPDRGRIVLNAFLGGAWGKTVAIRRYPFTLEPDVSFTLRFEVLPDRFRVFANGRHLRDFRHRVPPQRIDTVRATTFVWRLETGGRAETPEIVPNRPPGGWRHSWVAAEANPRDRRPVSFRLFAILGTWMEEDVVAATVANCLRQGCEAVFLVDNGSTDATVERAVAAGATLAHSFTTERYDERARMAVMQGVVEDASRTDGAEHIWWLWLDADEFHHGPAGMTLHDYLSTLDRRFRVVGARFFNHLPDREPAYLEGRHPLDLQPLCYEIPQESCELGHSNHPLQRWDRNGPPLVSGPGAHTASSDETLLEPTVPVFFHHFPYREGRFTRRRLLTLFGRNDASLDRVGRDPNHAHLRARLASLDAVYAERWDEVAFFPACAPGYVPELRRWEDWVCPQDRDVARWY
jgi:hypothetical protein